MKIKFLFFLMATFLLLSCGPYRGFKGVNPKGMKNNKMPSQEIRDGHKKSGKKMKRKYRREMKKRVKKMGTPKE